MSNVWGWVNSINDKTNILDDGDIKQYIPYIVNKALSYHLDAILFSNEMNQYSSIPPECQYAFYFNALPKRKRFAKWAKKDSTEDIDLIKRYYDVSESKAYEMMDLFSKKEIEYIKNKLKNCELKQ